MPITTENKVYKYVSKYKHILLWFIELKCLLPPLFAKRILLHFMGYSVYIPNFENTPQICFKAQTHLNDQTNT